MRRLPEGYREIKRIDLMKNGERRSWSTRWPLRLQSDGCVGLRCVRLSAVHWESIPFSTLLFLVSVLLYTVLHELIHGVFMKSFPA